MSAGLGEVAEAMYQAIRATTPAKTPESIDEMNVATQQRYLTMAKAAMATIGNGAITVPADDGLLDLFAEELAYTLLHPQSWSERTRTAFARYAEAVGPAGLSDEVKAAMEI